MPAKLDLPEREICEKYESGSSMPQLADEYKCNLMTIKKRLKENGIKIRNASEAALLREGMGLPDLEICQLYISGKSMEDLTEIYNCSAIAIEYRLLKNNIKFRTNSETKILACKNDPTIAERQSAIGFGILYEEWEGFASDDRQYLLPESECDKLNERFPNSHFHHFTKSLGAYIPEELHRHYYPHNIRTGLNMGEINMVTLQFINGGL